MGLLEILLSPVLTQGQRLENLIMGIKEDFATFKLAVMDALAEITDDIQRLKDAAAAAGNTPQEVLDGMAEIQAKLGIVRNLDNPVEPPPVEPL